MNSREQRELEKIAVSILGDGMQAMMVYESDALRAAVTSNLAEHLNELVAFVDRLVASAAIDMDDGVLPMEFER